MPDQELNLILRLKDEATSQLSSIRNQVTVAAAAMAAAGFKAGAEWDRATKTIVEGTGATGEALKGLQSDYQAVARYGPQAATAIADLNTHLGLQGEELQAVAEAALKAQVDTNAFGDVSSQLGLDAQGAAQFLDQLVTASQGTGVSVDQLTNTIGKNAARWQAAGGDMDALTATVVLAADEFGPAGLRGAMSEVMAEVDKGLIPSVASLETQLGDTTGAVESTYEAGRTWRDVLREQKDALLATIGPYGDMAGGIGTAAAGLLQLIPVLKGSAVAQKALNLAMRLNPIGLIITAIALAGAAIWKWRDQIWNFITGAWQGLMDGLRAGYNWIAKWIPGMEQLEEVTVAETVATDAAAESVEDFGAAAEEVATTEAPSLIEALGSASGTGGVAGAARAVTDAAEEAEAAFERMTRNAVEDVGRMNSTLQDIFANRLIRTVTEGGMAMGTQFSAAFEAGMMSGPGGLVTVLPKEMVATIASTTDQTRPTWIESGLAAGGGFAKSFTSRLAADVRGGGSFTDAFKAQLAEWGQNIQGYFADKISSVLNMVPVVGPLLAEFGPVLLEGIKKLAGKVWGGIKRLFGGPDEAELQAREMFEGFRSAATDKLGATEAYAHEVQSAIAQGWDKRLAETVAAFLTVGKAAGATHDEAFLAYEEYERATREGDLETMRRIEAQYAEWEAMAAGTFEKVAADAHESNEKIVQDTQATADRVTAALSDIRAPTVAIDFDIADIKIPNIGDILSGIPTRHTGGQVSAGSTYSTIPGEVFVPRQSGTVINPGLIDYDRLGAAVARAVAASPPTIAQNPVTDAILRNMPRREALRGWAPA